MDHYERLQRPGRQCPPARTGSPSPTSLLQGLGFRGFVVSDYQSVGELIDHGLAANNAEAARFALTAGVDMEMVSTTYLSTVAAQVKAKKIPQSVVDEAVRHASSPSNSPKACSTILTPTNHSTKPLT